MVKEKKQHPSLHLIPLPAKHMLISCHLNKLPWDCVSFCGKIIQLFVVLPHTQEYESFPLWRRLVQTERALRLDTGIIIVWVEFSSKQSDFAFVFVEFTQSFNLAVQQEGCFFSPFSVHFSWTGSWFAVAFWVCWDMEFKHLWDVMSKWENNRGKGLWQVFVKVLVYVYVVYVLRKSCSGMAITKIVMLIRHQTNWKKSTLH